MPETEPIRIALVCAITSLRVGLRSLLALPQVELLGEAAAPDCVGALPLPPDILVVATPGIVAPDWLDSLDQQFPNLPLLWIGDFNGTRLPLDFFKNRPVALLPLECTPAEIAAVLQGLMQDLTILAPPFLSAYLTGNSPQLPARRPPSPESSPDSIEALTSREMEVLQFLALGLANKEISRRLGISEHTVKYHISSIYSKLGVSNRTEAAAEGLRRGLVSV